MSKQQTLEQLIANDSFVRWIKGKASSEERAYWQKWKRQNPEHEQLVQQAGELIKLIGSDESAIPDPKGELEKFETKLSNLDVSPEKSRIRSITHKRSGLFYGAVAASIIFLIVSLGLFIYAGNDSPGAEGAPVSELTHEFRTSFGEKIDLTLKDGSMIVLNANSHLKYSNAGEERGIDVWLEGEAYFDITHLTGEDQRFFTVHTTQGAIEVLGTQFAVKTDSDETRAVLEKGEIRIKIKNGDPSISERTPEVVMHPGEMVRFSAGDRNPVLEKVNTAVYTSWRQDKWVFDQTPLTEVARRMEDTFGVEVVIRREGLKQKLLAGSIKSTKLDILKQALGKLLDVSVTQKGDTIVIG